MAEQEDVGTTMEALDADAVRWLRGQVTLHHTGQIDTELNPEEFLTEMGLRHEDGALTHAAALLFGRPPLIGRLQPAGIVDFRAHYHASHHEGLPANRWDDREFCDGHLVAAFRSLASRLYRLCPQPFAMESNGLQRRAYSPDYLAVREAFVNLLIHQDYTDRHRTASVLWYRDAVVLENPGDSRVSPEQLLAGSGASVLRNPLLARVLRRAGFCEQLGAGMRSIRRTWDEAGREPPQIESDPGLKTFRLVLPWPDLVPGRHQEREEVRRQGRKEGLEEGLRQGEASLLERLLRRRFAELPRWAFERLEQATREELERWSERALEARRLEDVFSSP